MLAAEIKSIVPFAPSEPGQSPVRARSEPGQSQAVFQSNDSANPAFIGCLPVYWLPFNIEIFQKTVYKSKSKILRVFLPFHNNTVKYPTAPSAKQC